MRRLIQGAVVLSLWLGAADGAAAAPAWLPPVELGAAKELDGPRVGLDSEGDAVAVWLADDDSKADCCDRVRAAMRPAGGAWSAPQTISPAEEDATPPRLAVGPSGHAVAIWSAIPHSPEPGEGEKVKAAVMTPAGAWGATDTLSGLAGSPDPEVAVDADGDAIAIWRDVGESFSRIMVSKRPAGEGWPADGEFVSSSALPAGDPDIAVDSAGNAIAVWVLHDTVDTIEARASAAGGGFGITQTVSSDGAGDAAEPDIAYREGGHAVAAWKRFDGLHNRIEAASRSTAAVAGVPGFLPAVELSAPGQNAGLPRVGLDQDGDAVAVWVRSDGINTLVESDARSAAGAWGATDVLSAPGENASLPEVAVSPAGDAAAVWQRVVGGDIRAQAAVRPAAGGFGLPIEISPAGANAAAPHVALDPQGNAVAAWYRADAAEASHYEDIAIGGTGDGGGSQPGSTQPVEAIGASSRDVIAPRISGASMTNRRFRVGKRRTATAARRKAKVGTAFRYQLSEAATVAVLIERRVVGRSIVRPEKGKLVRHCRKPGGRARERRCIRHVAIGALRRTGSAGLNQTAFSGRLGRKPLRPGRYRATLVATDAASNRSDPRRLGFRVVRR